MAEPVKKTKSTAKPRKGSTKKDEVAGAVKTNTAKQADQPAKAEASKKTTATDMPHIVSAKRDNVVEISKPATVSREAIAQLAYCFWAQRGYQHGDALQDWLRAEQELLHKASLLQKAS
jgi:hypothetical protein